MSLLTGREVNVKCRAMYARLLGQGDYDALMSMKNVNQIASYLKKQTPYAYVLRGIDENDVHRGQLERLFKRSLFYDYERLLKFTAGSYRSAIRAIFESYEVEDLKLVIGSVRSEHEKVLEAEDLAYIRAYSEIPTELLLGAETMEKLVENLKGTRYYEPLLPFASDNRADFLEIEHALNLLNYRSLTNAFKKTLRGAERGMMCGMFDTRADIENIMFIYRTKKLFGLPVSETALRLLPSDYKINKRELLDLAECADIGAMVERLGATYYGFLFPADRESEWESVHSGYFRDMNAGNIRGAGGGISAAYAYLYLKELDIKNIVMIIEGVRYSLPEDRIASFIIGRDKTPAIGAAG